MPPTNPQPKRRKWLRRLTVLSILSLTVAALPRLASTPPALRGMLTMANRRLAPAKLEASSIHLSWLGSNQVTGLVLRDKEGKSIVAVDRLTHSGGLLSFVRSTQRNLDLYGVNLDYIRREGGTSNLEDALAPLMAKAPTPEPELPRPSSNSEDLGLPATPWIVSIVSGSIKITAPELLDPISAKSVEGMLVFGGAKSPTTFKLNLANPEDGDKSKIEISGDYVKSAKADTPPSMSATIKADRWPWSFNQGQNRGKGRFQGTLFGKRENGLWNYTGDGRWLDLMVTGSSLSGDRVRLDEVITSYELAETPEGYDFKKLDFRSPLGNLRAVDPATRAEELGKATRIEGKIDLAACMRQMPRSLRIREGLDVERGEATLAVDVAGESVKDVRKLIVQVELSDVRAREGERVVELRKPGSFRAKLTRKAGGFGVEELTLKTAFLQAKGSGDFDKGVNISASFDLERLQQELKSLVDFGGVNVAGKGQLAADYKHASGATFASRLSAEFQGLKVVGLTDDPITHDFLRVDVTSKGTTIDWGLPVAWTHAQVGVKSDNLNMDASLASKASSTALMIDSLRAAYIPRSLEPTKEPRKNVEAIKFAARGRFDPKDGIFELQPLAGVSRPEPFALAGNGLRVVGIGTPEQRVEWNVIADLGRLDRAMANYTGQPAYGVRGKASLQGGALVNDSGKVELGANLQSQDLSISKAGSKARRALGPSVISLRLLRDQQADPLRFDPLIVAGPCGRVDALGTFDQKQQIELQGKITPTWEAVDQFLVAAIDPTTRVRCEPRPFVLKARVDQNNWVDSFKTLEGELGFDRVEATMLGMKIAPVAIVAHSGPQGILVDPIETSLNNGKVKLLPEVKFDEKGALTVGLGAGSQIVDAEINDEVSKNFLAYIAPVLADAGQVRGRFSAQVDRADFPLTGHESNAEVVGEMKFNDVLFNAGELTGELLSMAGSHKNAQLRLSEPIELRVTGGRVYQRGLSVPINRNARLVVEGSVGFDKTLALKARLPIAKGALGGTGELEQLVDDLKVGIPIGGTLSRPQIDSQALRLSLKNVNKSALKKKAAGLLEKLVQPEGESEGNNGRPR